VAKLAGMPLSVLTRAEQVLNKLNSSDKKSSSNKKTSLEKLPLFNLSPPEKALVPKNTHRVEAKLKNIMPDEISPKDALELIYTLKEMLSD
jgi:DNA mismatch repair protein MutS